MIKVVTSPDIMSPDDEPTTQELLTREEIERVLARFLDLYLTSSSEERDCEYEIRMIINEVVQD